MVDTKKEILIKLAQALLLQKAYLDPKAALKARLAKAIKQYRRSIPKLRKVIYGRI